MIALTNSICPLPSRPSHPAGARFDFSSGRHGARYQSRPMPITESESDDRRPTAIILRRVASPRDFDRARTQTIRRTDRPRLLEISDEKPRGAIKSRVYASVTAKSQRRENRLRDFNRRIRHYLCPSFSQFVRPSVSLCPSLPTSRCRESLLISSI